VLPSVAAPAHVTSYARVVADADAEAGADTDATHPSGAPAGGHEPLINAEALAGITTALGWLLGVAAAGLAVTGLPLVWLYQPDTSAGRGDFWWLRGAHNVMSMAFLGAAAGMVVVLSVGFVRRVRVPPGWLVGLGILLVALLGLISGQLIAWDSLALRGVTVGTDVRGIVDAISETRSVFVEGTEVSRGAYAAWAGVHALAVPLVAAAIAWAVRRRQLRREP
jgi:quinol-cytochrome oxidoreductase complex cytochrome b subunit